MIKIKIFSLTIFLAELFLLSGNSVTFDSFQLRNGNVGIPKFSTFGSSLISESKFSTHRTLQKFISQLFPQARCSTSGKFENWIRDISRGRILVGVVANPIRYKNFLCIFKIYFINLLYTIFFSIFSERLFSLVLAKKNTKEFFR